MKTIILATIGVIVISTMAWAQNYDDFRSAASGEWENTSTWQYFNGSSWVTPIEFPSFSNEVITVRSGHNVTFGPDAWAWQLDQVIVESGGQITGHL